MESPSPVAVSSPKNTDTDSENSTDQKANSNPKESGKWDVAGGVKDSDSDSKSELQIKDIVDMLKKLKLNPLAKEFFPSSYHNGQMGSNNFVLAGKNSGIDGSPINRRRRNNNNQGRRRMGVRTFRAQREDSIRRTVYVSDIDHNIGQGTYSNVYRARNVETGKMVALKKVRFDNFQPEIVRFMAREIMILRKLDHPNIMKLEGIITSRLSCNIYLVFEYMEHDLAGLLSCPDIKFSDAQIKCYMRQLLCGLEHCHSQGIMHRDIKASNILVNNLKNESLVQFKFSK
ncbi:Protein kinase domain-containing protein [Abeliophyllum distichum]|uniref:Protein kinase domain-containing protein n=1 Tax=Abeliophyllum distichum TaxID=126358 RepID=A0ABD1V3D2_9LAMI